MTWTQWPALITWLTLILLVAVVLDVGRARSRYGVHAPATSGNEQFERVFRVQMNTLENVVMFLPALWLAAWYWKPVLASACGALWLIGRIWYARAYVRDPARRHAGYGLSFSALGALMVAAAIGWVRAAAWT
jgi:glutathione S-transferase